VKITVYKIPLQHIKNYAMFVMVLTQRYTSVYSLQK